ncbi:MAG: amidohydrolase, partial [Deltaproteobacteria bacterium]|nr:amidohydrolase [Deltaproteobacteria bacterium]
VQHQKPSLGVRGAGSQPVDDWAALGVESEQELVDLFVPRFYFGCEADDPMTSSAFNTRVNPFGSRLRAVLGSDIGHWDVPDMSEVMPEVLEPLDAGWLTAQDLRDFVFTHPVSFYTDTNPDFFEGTAVEGEVRTARSQLNPRSRSSASP